jgi:hypothetical protein
MSDSNPKTIRLSDLKSVDSLDKELSKFSLFLNISEVQSAANGGINFELGMQYEGANDSAIHNPIYFLQYVLKGSDKTLLYKGGKPPIPLINRQGPIDETTDFNFDILRITRNGEDLNIREEVNRPIVTFQNGDKRSYDLQISRLLNQQTRHPEDIPEGTCHLELLLSLVKSDTTGGAVQNRTLGAQDVSFLFEKER